MSDRISLILVIGCIALFFTLICFNNITDFETNADFVKRVVGMEGIKAQAVLWRAVTSPTLVLIIYIAIIATEAVVAALLWVGVVLLALGRDAKKFAEIGLVIGFCLFMLGFLVVGSEWFYMWQNPNIYNLPIKVTAFSTLLLLAKFYVSQINEFLEIHH